MHDCEDCREYDKALKKVYKDLDTMGTVMQGMGNRNSRLFEEVATWRRRAEQAQAKARRYRRWFTLREVE